MSAAQVSRLGLPERWRKPALVGGSVVFHAIVLAALGLQAVDIDEAQPLQPDAVFVDIAPRPMLKDETARIRTAARSETAPDRLALPGQSATSPALALRDPREQQLEQSLPTSPSPRIGTPAAGVPAPPGFAGWTVRSETQDDRVERGLNSSNLACRTQHLLTPAEQTRCNERMANAANTTQAIRGSGDPDTDYRFARAGAARLAAYDARREALTPGRPVCPETRSPIGDCGVEVKIDIWSSREGFLPRQRGDD